MVYICNPLSIRMKQLLIILSLLVTAVQARDHYVFSPIDTNDGLSENTVCCITQLADGRMVVVTNSLVNLYDGASFHYIHYDDEKKYPLPAYFGFYHVYVDTQERLWIKDYQKLMLFDLRTESFVPDLAGVLSTEGIEVPLADFFMDSKHNFWYLTCQNELIFREENKNEPAVFISNVSNLTPEDDVLYDLAVYKNQLFLFFKSGTMICFNLDTKKELYRENPFEKENAGLYERTLMVVPHKQFLYQVRNGETGILLRYDVETRKWKTILKEEYAFNTLSVDSNDNLWVSSSQGLWYIDNDLQENFHIPELHLVDGRTFQAVINTQYSDNQGGLWVGTSNRGLLYYHPDRFKFRNIGRTLFETKDDRELRVTCFVEQEDEVLVGTSNGLYHYFSHTAVPLVPFPGLPKNIHCRWLMKDSQQRIWLCTENDGLYGIHPAKIKHYTFPFHTVFYMHETPEGLFYLSTNEGGLGVFDPLSGNYKPIETFKENAVGFIYQLINYGPDTWMLLSDAGLLVYNYKTDSLYIPASDKKEKTALFRQSNQKYNCLFADSRGLIWIGTEDGLNVWDSRENRLSSFHTENGLVNNYIQSITEDNQNRIWVSTSYGISCISIEKKTDSYRYSFINFNPYDGVISNEFTRRSAYPTTYGALLWGGIDGFNEIDISRANPGQQHVLPPLFVKFFLFGTEIKQGDKYNGDILLKQSVASTKELNLKYNQNHITLEFSALNYINPTRTFYRYQLEGIDETWHEIEADKGIGRVNYTHLSPGTYHLKVFAANNGREWNSQPVEMKIVISPPFWKTPLAYLFYALLLVLLFYFAISSYLRGHKHKIEQQQKEDLDQMKFRFFTNISHELRTPLTLIITPLGALLKKIEDEKLKEQLTGIHRNANDLLKMVNQLLDFRKIEMTGESLRLSYFNITEFMDSLCSPFQLLAQNKEIDFRWEYTLPDLYVHADKDKLHKIVNNLLSNAYKFTDKGGKITLLLDKRPFPDETTEALVLQITDTGCGIPEKELPKIFNRFYQVDSKDEQNTGTGIGLHITQEYVQLHQGKILVESQVNQGSVFTVYIPLNLKLADKTATDVTNKGNENIVRILVVEDNTEFRTFLCNQLAENYAVITASNGKEGLDKAMELLPDLIISDVMMPEMDGFELCKRLKKEVRISHIPVILLTARSSDEAQIEGYEAGADAYISKPFNMDILLLRIQNLLEQQKQRKELFRKAIIIQPESITSTTVDEELINAILQCVEKNLNNPLYSVEQLSHDMNMDRTGLYRKLVAITGQTPSTFIRSIRLKRAAQLLKQGLPVSEVSDLVGFGTASYFTQCFKEEFGMKPSQYS